MNPFLGEIRLMSFTFAPKGWAQCNGQLLPINQNQALFSLLGTEFGGDGRVTFALPDLRARVPAHLGGGSFGSVGQRGGESAHTLTSAELPTHTHAVAGSSSTQGGNQKPAGRFLGGAGNAYHAPRAATAMHPQTVGNAGGSQAHTNQQPYLVVMFCIATVGIFPSVN